MNSHQTPPTNTTHTHTTTTTTTNNNHEDVPTTTISTPPTISTPTTDEKETEKIRDTPVAVTPVTTIEDSGLQQKYNLLKKRVREIEEDNDTIHNKLTKAMRQIKRLRVERIVLLEELDNSRQYGRERKAAANGGVSDSEGSVSDSITTKETLLKTPGKRARGGKSKGLSKHHQNQENGTTTTPARKKRDPNAPKGPGNVFFLYCRLERDNIKDQLSSDNLGEATRLLGQKWKALSKEEKQVYYDMYNKEQKEFEAAMELYNASGGSANPNNVAATSTNGTKAAKAAKDKTEREEVEDDENVDMLHEDEDDEDDEEELEEEEDDGITTTTTIEQPEEDNQSTPARSTTDEPMTEIVTPQKQEELESTTPAASSSSSLEPNNNVKVPTSPDNTKPTKEEESTTTTTTTTTTTIAPPSSTDNNGTTTQ